MDRPDEMTPEERDDWLLDRMATAFPRDLFLAADALLSWARGADGDGYPRPPDVVRFARFYRVSAPALGGLVGLLPLRIDSKTTIWADQVRVPQNRDRLAIERFPRDAMRGYGIFCAAASKVNRETAPRIH